MTIRMTYLFDPLCGWCYGAGPAIAWLRQQADIELAWRPVGLFLGEGAAPLSAQFRDHIRAADRRIAALSRQVFSEAYERNVLGDPKARIDSGPASLALCVFERHRPGRGLDYLAAVQRQRYVQGRDIADAAVLIETAVELGANGAGFAAALADPAEYAAAEALIEQGRDAMSKAGAQGVPTLLLGDSVVPSAFLYQSERLRDLLAA